MPRSKGQIYARMVYKPKPCSFCKREYIPTNGVQKWCSAQCAQDDYRVCKKCGETKQGKEFYLRDGGFPNGNCKPCANAITAETAKRLFEADPEKARQGRRKRVRAYAKRHPEKVAWRLAKWKRANKYGITQEWYESTLAAQGGLCAICRGLGRYGDKTRDLDVDHCHTTGKVRGLLCTQCNHGIGRFMDLPDRLRAAAAYLDQYH